MKDKERAWVVVWVSEATEFQGRGKEPLTYDEAAEFAEWGNKHYPDLRHDVAPWCPETENIAKS